MWYFLTNSYATTHYKWYISEQEALLAAQKYVNKVYTYTWYLLAFKIYPVKVKEMK